MSNNNSKLGKKQAVEKSSRNVDKNQKEVKIFKFPKKSDVNLYSFLILLFLFCSASI